MAIGSETRRERPEDQRRVRLVNEFAFGRPNEANLVDALRAAGAMTLSLVAVRQGEVVGHILFSPVTVAAPPQNFAAAGLGPMAVLPNIQRQGIGSTLVRAGLAELRRVGHEVVVVLGHPDYYPRFGFVRASTRGIGWEHQARDEAVMVLELAPGALVGRDGVCGIARSSRQSGREAVRRRTSVAKERDARLSLVCEGRCGPLLLQRGPHGHNGPTRFQRG